MVCLIIGEGKSAHRLLSANENCLTKRLESQTGCLEFQTITREKSDRSFGLWMPREILSDRR
jgi:hypothetical protein